MSFFDDLDLTATTKGPKPFFETGAEVMLGVNSVEEKTAEYGTSLNVVCKVLNTSQEGASLTLRLDPSPKNETKKAMLVGVMNALYGSNWTTTAVNNLSTGVGKKISAVALEKGNFNGNTYQHFTAIKNAGVDSLSDIPF